MAENLDPRIDDLFEHVKALEERVKTLEKQLNSFMSILFGASTDLIFVHEKVKREIWENFIAPPEGGRS